MISRRQFLESILLGGTGALVTQRPVPDYGPLVERPINLPIKISSDKQPIELDPGEEALHHIHFDSVDLKKGDSVVLNVKWHNVGEPVRIKGAFFYYGRR